MATIIQKMNLTLTMNMTGTLISIEETHLIMMNTT